MRWTKAVFLGSVLTWLAGGCSSRELEVSSDRADGGAPTAASATSTVLAVADGAVRNDARVPPRGSAGNAGIEAPQQTRAWSQRTKLVGDEATDTNLFGDAVAISGNTAVIGAWRVNNVSGAAYVYDRTGTNWTRSAVLLPSDPVEFTGFGQSLALSGNTAVVMGSGAYVFTRSGQAWSQTAKLDVVGVTNATIDGNTILAASPGGANMRGSVYVLGLAGGTWAQVAQLVASDGGLNDLFGYTIALSGDTALVARFSGSSVYVFTRSGGTWTETTKLTPNDAGGNDGVGRTLAIDGDTALIGAPLQNGHRGAAYVFTRSGGVWSQTAKFVDPDGLSNDVFGAAISLRGNLALIGALGASSYYGAAYLFTSTNGVWNQTARWGGQRGEQFGQKVAVDGSVAVVGAPFSATGPGSAYVYDNLRIANGDACTASADCASSFCVDGVCCDSVCNGTCQACTSAKKGAGADGTCGPIASGHDPDAECTTTCSGSTLNAAGGCVGTSAACAAPTVSSCAPFACNAAGTACASMCTLDTDCDGNSFCKAGTCATKQANGSACSSTKECLSGECADGVCCNVACSGTCEACVFYATGQADGTCASVVDGRDPRSDCLGSSCASGTVTSHVCNGSGSCRAQTTSCSPYACTSDGKGCATSCASDDDCASNQFCDATHACASKNLAGTRCSSARECGTGFCVDGICCGSACDGQCEACTEPGSVGSCVPVRGAPRAGHAACAGSGSECGGTCDGVHASSCTFPTTSTTCGSGCTSARISTCDGAGTCGAPTACSGGLTCNDTSACKTSCSTDDDCVTGLVCDVSSGTCGARTASGSGATSPGFYGSGGGCAVEGPRGADGTRAPMVALATLGLAMASRRRRRRG